MKIQTVVHFFIHSAVNVTNFVFPQENVLRHLRYCDFKVNNKNSIYYVLLTEIYI